MRGKFQLCKTSKIYLYGAASCGKLMFSYLNGVGYTVEAFIDRRADEIKEFLGRRVLTLDEFEFETRDREDVVTIIAVKNVFDHDKIAFELVQRKCFNIIYRPRCVIDGQGNEEQNQISRIYSLIEKNNLLIDNVSLLRTSEIVVNRWGNTAIVKELGDLLIVNVPIEIVYTDKKEMENFESDKPIFTLESHIELYEYYEGRINQFPIKYLGYCIDAAQRIGDIKVTEAWKNNVLENRQMIYNEMSYNLECNFNFFINNAPFASWNKKGYFNLHSGKHRAAFFASKNLRFLPLRLKRSDYNKWINEVALGKIHEYMEKNQITKLKAPIPHPNFYQMHTEKPNYVISILKGIDKYISKHMKQVAAKKEKLKILDVSDDMGCLARYLFKSGYLIDRYIYSEWEFEELINELLHIKEGINIVEYEGEYDVVLDLGGRYKGSCKVPYLYITDKKSCPIAKLQSYTTIIRTFWENKDTEIRIYY